MYRVVPIKVAHASGLPLSRFGDFPQITWYPIGFFHGLSVENGIP